jgi:23S rRNA (pseudouridine1915-N3)-methyltransferase
MKLTLLLIGKTTEKYLEQGIQLYCDRLKHYTSFEMKVIPELKDAKHLSFSQQKAKEAELIMKSIDNTDFLVLLDERGKECTSIEFAKMLEQHALYNMKDMVFLVGGPYGVDELVVKRANATISLSNMTFSHQMVRLFFVEQLYRAYTIIKGEPYHHE